MQVCGKYMFASVNVKPGAGTVGNPWNPWCQSWSHFTLIWSSYQPVTKVSENETSCFSAEFSPSNTVVQNNLAVDYSCASIIYCMITSGSMLKSRSSLSLLTSSSRAVSSCSAACRSAVVIRGLPFSFTIMSPSLMPPLGTDKQYRDSISWNVLHSEMSTNLYTAPFLNNE